MDQNQGEDFHLEQAPSAKYERQKEHEKEKNLENLYTMFRKLRNKRKPYNILTW